MTKFITYIIILIILTGCSENIKQDRFENEIINCIQSRYEKKKVNFRQEVSRFQSFMVNEKVLRDSSGASYYYFYDELMNVDSFPDLPGKFDVDTGFINQFEILSECLNIHKKDQSEEYQNSRYAKYRDAIRKSYEREDVSPEVVSQNILSILDSNDFELLIYKIPLLTQLYYMESEQVERNKRDALPSIELTIHSDSSMYVNGKETTWKYLKSDLKKAASMFSEKEREIMIVRLKVESETRMGIVTRVKEELRNINFIRISYSTMDANK